MLPHAFVGGTTRARVGGSAIAVVHRVIALWTTTSHIPCDGDPRRGRRRGDEDPRTTCLCADAETSRPVRVDGARTPSRRQEIALCTTIRRRTFNTPIEKRFQSRGRHQCDSQDVQSAPHHCLAAMIITKKDHSSNVRSHVARRGPAHHDGAHGHVMKSQWVQKKRNKFKRVPDTQIKHGSVYFRRFQKEHSHSRKQYDSHHNGDTKIPWTGRGGQ